MTQRAAGGHQGVLRVSFMTRQSVTYPHLHRLEIHPSSQTSCRSCSWVLSGCICQREGGRGGVFRNGLHPERSDLAPLTPGYTRRRPSPPGRNSLHTRTVRLADPRRFRRISLETIRRALIVRVLCRKVVKLNQNNDRTEFSLICILHSRNIHQH